MMDFIRFDNIRYYRYTRTIIKVGIFKPMKDATEKFGDIKSNDDLEKNMHYITFVI